MTSPRKNPSRDSAGEAITRILRAEQQAESSVAEARVRADQRVASAREHARAISARLDARLAALNALCRKTTARIIEQIGEETGRTMALSIQPIPESAIRRAVDATKRWLLAAEEER